MSDVTMGKDIERSSSIRRTRPSELSVPMPRKVRMDTSGGRFIFFVVLFCFSWGGAILGFHGYDAFGEIRQRDALRQRGYEAMGEVINETNHRGAPASVSYTFSVNEVTYSGNAQLPVFRRMIIHKSDPIAIRFLPSNPAINHPESWEWAILGEIDMAELLMPFLIGAGWVALIHLLRDRKLARKGKAVEGVVIDCGPDKTEFRVKYEFHTEDGVQIRGSCDSEEEFEKGANIWILYLPGRPRRNHSYPTEFFSVVE
jgi:uncharacterized protein DUF3592